MAKIDLGRITPTYRGRYETNTSYSELDIVEFNGSSYIARKSVTGMTPGTDDTSWGLIANKGIKGDKGDKGDRGDRGPQGSTGPAGDKGEKGEVDYSKAVTLENDQTISSKKIFADDTTLLSGNNGIRVNKDSNSPEYTFDGGTTWVDNRASKTYVNIQEFGIHGAVDTAVEDTEIIIKAMKDTAANSQILYFPAGNYYIGEGLPLLDNLNIKASNQAKFYQVAKTYTFKSKEGKGYGAGGKNIRISGGQWIGKEDYSTPIYFNLMHLYDVVFSDMTFLRAVVSGHVFDTQACKKIRFENITFIGMKANNDRYFTEAIQLDSSTAVGSSNSYEKDTYDGLACEDIIINNCKTLPEFDENGKIISFAPSLTGMHAQTEGSTHHNVRITNNFLQDVNPRPLSTSWQTGGSMHLRNVYDLTIENNSFYRTVPLQHATAEINVTIGETICPKDSIDVINPNFVSNAYEDVYKIKIVNNSFEGMYSLNIESDRNDVGVVRVTGSKKFNIFIKNVIITGNIFKNTINPSQENTNTFNTDTGTFYIGNVSNLIISDNIFDNVFSIGTIQNSEAIIISRNSSRGVYRTILNLNNSKGMVSSNYVDTTHGKIEAVNGSDIDIIDNIIHNFSLSTPVVYRSIISQDASSVGKISGNSIDYTGSNNAIYTQSSKLFITGNSVNFITAPNEASTGLVSNNLVQYNNNIASSKVVVVSN